MCISSHLFFLDKFLAVELLADFLEDVFIFHLIVIQEVSIENNSPTSLVLLSLERFA